MLNLVFMKLHTKNFKVNLGQWGHNRGENNTAYTELKVNLGQWGHCRGENNKLHTKN